MTRVAAGQLAVPDTTSVYMSPQGRRCRCLEVGSDCEGRQVAHFAYQAWQGGAIPESRMADGFSLTSGNWRVMRKVG